MNITLSKSDNWGIIASILCMIHCFATPFIFVAIAGTSTTSEDAPFWWLLLNYFFLIISFFAVLKSAQTSSKSFMKPLFWISWVSLAFVVFNEQFGWIELGEIVTYLLASALVALHFYNRQLPNA